MKSGSKSEVLTKCTKTVVVQLLRHVQLFVTPWTTALQVSESERSKLTFFSKLFNLEFLHKTQICNIPPRPGLRTRGLE